jgi:hypothetical protein
MNEEMQIQEFIHNLMIKTFDESEPEISILNFYPEPEIVAEISEAFLTKEAYKVIIHAQMHPEKIKKIAQLKLV